MLPLATITVRRRAWRSLFELMNDRQATVLGRAGVLSLPKGQCAGQSTAAQWSQPFQAGTYEQRILAIKTFGDKCALIPSLVPLSVNVLAFHTQIASARALQQSAGEGQVAALRDFRETARVALCNEMYGDLGLLMHHHRTNPTEVERYFDFSLLRTKKKTKQNTELKFSMANALDGRVDNQRHGRADACYGRSYHPADECRWGGAFLA
jgi:hypothetical protein